MVDCVTLNIWKPSDVEEGTNGSDLHVPWMASLIGTKGGGNYYNVRSANEKNVHLWTSIPTDIDPSSQSARGFPMADWVNITYGELVAVRILYRVRQLPAPMIPR